MTHYLVDVCHYTHTCPADRAPHVVDTCRTVVEGIPADPCQQPVTVRSGDTTTVLDCRRVLPGDQQCPACRTVITVRRETTIHLGPYAVAVGEAPTGHADDPCRICGEPLAAVLASWGVHILCHRYGRS
jgi:hypothetical protein